jgi:hypothetical protein
MARKSEGQKERKTCKCGKRPVAINYKKNGTTHYRSYCSTCTRNITRKKYQKHPNYTIKKVCEKCGFKAIYPEQLNIYTVKGTVSILNLKTVCLNCEKELAHTNTWPQGDLIADF